MELNVAPYIKMQPRSSGGIAYMIFCQDTLHLHTLTLVHFRVRSTSPGFQTKSALWHENLNINMLNNNVTKALLKPSHYITISYKYIHPREVRVTNISHVCSEQVLLNTPRRAVSTVGSQTDGLVPMLPPSQHHLQQLLGTRNSQLYTSIY